MKRNIAIMINSLGRGGAERVVSRIAEPLAQYYNIYILLLDTTTLGYDCAGSILDIGGNRKEYYIRALHAGFHINKIIEKYQIECVISLLDIPNLLNVVCVRRCKTIVSLRNYMNEAYYRGVPSRIKLNLCKHLFCRADRIVAVSRALEEISIPYFNLKYGQTCTIENPFDVQKISLEAETEIEDIAAEFIKTHRTSVAVGRLVEQKGYPILLQCFKHLCEREERAGLIILGSGNMEQKLRDLTKKLEIEEQVLFLGIKRNPFSYMKRCELYVSASHFEGFPNSLVEAMACSLPVLHTDCLTGPREILSQNKEQKLLQVVEYAEYGVLAPDFNRIEQMDITLSQAIALFADAWKKLLEDESMRKCYGMAAYKRAQDYSLDKCVEGYHRVIEEVI